MKSPAQNGFLSRLPWKSLGLMATAVFTFILCALYVLKANPEIRFLKSAWEVKSQSLATTASRSGRILWAGGSSVLVGVKPDLIEAETHRKVLNLGMAAGMGPEVLIQLAMDQAREGDILLLSLEPELLTLPSMGSMLGSQVAWSTGHPEWLGSLSPDEWLVSVSHLRPGAYHFFTMTTKVLLGRPLYRYSADEIETGGWQRIRAQEDFPGVPVWYYRLLPEARALLSETAHRCRDAGVAVYYMPLPHFCPPDREKIHREGMAMFLMDVDGILPVIDPVEGYISTDPSHFADTPWHPIPDVAEDNARRLANSLNLSVLSR